MEPMIVDLIRELGSSGVTAFYVYLAVSYGTKMIVFGIVAWGFYTGVRAVLKSM